MNTDLPLFVYGALRKGELAHRQVAAFVNRVEACVEIPGFELLVVDGIARAMPESGKRIQGDLIFFSKPNQAYDVVAKFENVPFDYKWSQGESPFGKVNLLIADRGVARSRNNVVETWTSAADGLLGHAIPWSFSRLTAIKAANTETKSDMEYWAAYHDLQSTLLLLWALTERILLFRDGSANRRLSLGDRVKALGTLSNYPEMLLAVQEAKINQQMGVRSNRSPYARHPKRTGETGFPAWYDMRNNVAHRGKGTAVEQGILWTATVDLHNTLAIYLQSQSEPILNLWRNLLKSGEASYPDRLYIIRR